jgi:hypothetical protein
VCSILEQPFCGSVTYTFTNGTAGSADYTTTNSNNCTCGNYGTVSYNTADTCKINETLLLLWNRFGYGTIIDNDNLLL